MSVKSQALDCVCLAVTRATRGYQRYQCHLSDLVLDSPSRHQLFQKDTIVVHSFKHLVGVPVRLAFKVQAVRYCKIYLLDILFLKGDKRRYRLKFIKNSDSLHKDRFNS